MTTPLLTIDEGLQLLQLLRAEAAAIKYLSSLDKVWGYTDVIEHIAAHAHLRLAPSDIAMQLELHYALLCSCIGTPAPPMVVEH